jgi:hypothetical protein
MRLRRWYYQFYASGEPKIALTQAAPSGEAASAAPSEAAAGPKAAVSSAGVAGAADSHSHAGCPAAGAADW